jgi:hypothetical protein
VRDKDGPYCPRNRRAYGDDVIVGSYGKKEVHATGVPGGIERLLISLERVGVVPNLTQAEIVFVAAVNGAVRQQALAVEDKLRASGISTNVDVINVPIPRYEPTLSPSFKNQPWLLDPICLPSGRIEASTTSS